MGAEPNQPQRSLSSCVRDPRSEHSLAVALNLSSVCSVWPTQCAEDKHTITSRIDKLTDDLKDVGIFWVTLGETCGREC